MRLIDADELKNKINTFYDKLFVGFVSSDLITFASGVDGIIDNAPTVEPYCPYLSGNEVKQPCIKAPCERPQGDITEEDIQNAIKAGYENGYSMAQAKYQRPQGEWIRKGNETNFWYKCDKCGCEPYYSHSIRTIKFCPNCGAEMVGGDKE